MYMDLDCEQYSSLPLSATSDSSSFSLNPRIRHLYGSIYLLPFVFMMWRTSPAAPEKAAGSSRSFGWSGHDPL